VSVQTRLKAVHVEDCLTLLALLSLTVGNNLPLADDVPAIRLGFGGVPRSRGSGSLRRQSDSKTGIHYLHSWAERPRRYVGALASHRRRKRMALTDFAKDYLTPNAISKMAGLVGEISLCNTESIRPRWTVLSQANHGPPRSWVEAIRLTENTLSVDVSRARCEVGSGKVAGQPWENHAHPRWRKHRHVFMKEPMCL
jgi:hypothetical protein